MKVVLTIFVFLVTLPAGAACPVGKKQGDTWCEKGMEWKCEKCGSEYCPIITGRKCVRDDDSSSGVLPARTKSIGRAVRRAPSAISLRSAAASS